MAVARTSNKRYNVRKARPKRPSPAEPNTRAKSTGRTEALPGWNELAKANQRALGSGRGATFLEKISTTRFALLIVALAILFTMYVGHVHATQDLLADVQQLRRENLQNHLKYNRLKGEFDQMVGPSVIYDRARKIGLEENAVYGPTIEVDR